jgi:hypothetical protein
MLKRTGRCTRHKLQPLRFLPVLLIRHLGGNLQFTLRRLLLARLRWHKAVVAMRGLVPGRSGNPPGEIDRHLILPQPKGRNAQHGQGTFMLRIVLHSLAALLLGLDVIAVVKCHLGDVR